MKTNEFENLIKNMGVDEYASGSRTPIQNEGQQDIQPLSINDI